MVKRKTMAEKLQEDFEKGLVHADLGKSASMVDKISKRPSDDTTSTNLSYIQIPLSQIDRDPNQPRKFFDEQSLSELSESIKKRGVLQPIIIRKNDNNSSDFILTAGERRYRAAKMAGLKMIPAIIRNHDDPEEIALIENIQRENLTPIEEASAYKKLKAKHNYSDRQLSEVVGKARSTIVNIMGLNNLCDKVKEGCLRVNTPQRVLILISKQKTEEEQIHMFNRYTKFNLSLEELKKKPEKNEISEINRMIFRINNLYVSLSKVEKDALLKEEIIQLQESLKPLRKLIAQINKW